MDRERVWTHGTWTVIPGRESESVRAWEELGDWMVKAGAHGRVLRDTKEANVFISFGPWPARDAVARWRGSDDFQNYFAAIRQTLERFRPASPRTRQRRNARLRCRRRAADPHRTPIQGIRRGSPGRATRPGLLTGVPASTGTGDGSNREVLDGEPLDARPRRFIRTAPDQAPSLG